MQDDRQEQPYTSTSRHPWWRRLDRLLPFAVLAVCLLMTFQLWRTADAIAVRDLKSEFDFRVSDLAGGTIDRMKAYEQVLRGVQGLFAASGAVDREEFSRYAATLRLEENYPGIQALSFSRLVPARRPGGLPQVPIAHIEPSTGANRRAAGFDLYSEPVRRAAMDQARDTGKAAISGRLRLVQETGPDAQRGFILFLPVYRNGSAAGSVEERRRDIIGWVSAPFRMGDLIRSIASGDHDDLDIRLYDGDRVSEEALMFDGRAGKRGSVPPLFQAQQLLMIAGHPWTLVVQSLPGFESRMDRSRPQLIAECGIGIGFLLALITWMLGNDRRKALENARMMRVYTQALQEAEKLALLGHFSYDPRTDRTFWSAGLERIWGFTDRSPARRFKDFLDTVHPDDLQVILDSDADKSWRETGTTFRIIRADGEIRHIQSCGYREFNAAGTIVRVFGIDQDVTDRKLAEAALLRSRDYYLKLLETFPALVWRSGTDAACDYFNQTWLRFTGRTLEEEIGEGWVAGVHPDDRDACVARYLDAFHQRQPFTMEYRLRRYDGAYRWIVDHGCPYYDLEGGFAGYIGSCYDINAQKALERALKDAHDRLEQRIAERTAELSMINAELLEQMEERKQLELRLVEAKRLEAIGQLAGGVAHEVRNPLNAILSITEALFREKELAENRELDPYVEHIRTQVGRLARLMNDLLELGKPIPLSSLYPLPLYSLCRETVTLWKSSGTAPNKRVLLAADNEPLWMHVLADGMKLQQVIFNLLENAGQHSGDQKIMLTLDEEQGTVPPTAVIRVTDRGCGIPGENLARVFDPFYSSRRGGTGLGLALVKHFIENMGGSVALRNNDPGPGCTAEVRIPLAKEEHQCSQEFC